MKATKKYPDYTIEAVSINIDKDYMKPNIETALQLYVQDSDVRCMKGDCCKDCPGNWIGG